MEFDEDGDEVWPMPVATNLFRLRRDMKACGATPEEIGRIVSYLPHLKPDRKRKDPAPNRGKGKVIAWLRAHASYQGDECLTWPFAYDKRNGRGSFGYNGETYNAERYMCQLAHGEPPEGHECAHSCGNGHKGCVNPRHLSWKTRAENQQDRRLHGTHGRGKERGTPRTKLTDLQVTRIREIGSAMSKEAIGRLYGITPSHVAKLQNGERRRDLLCQPAPEFLLR